MKHALFIVLLLCITACSERNPSEAGLELEPSKTVTRPISRDNSAATLKPVFQSAFVTAGLQSLTQLHQDTEQLLSSVETFLDNGSIENWAAIQSSWQRVHNQWHSSAFFLSAVQRFSNPGFPLTKILDNIHSAPITAGYLDSIEGYPFSGLVNDITVPITASAIRAQHQRFDAGEIALGLHVVEFFLWQKTPDSFAKPELARLKPEKSKPINQQPGNQQQTISIEQRRGKMLQVVAKLLTEDSQQLLTLWPATAELSDKKHHQEQVNPILTGAISQLLAMTVHSPVGDNRYAWQQQICVDLQQQLQHFIADDISKEQMTQVNNHLDNIQQNLDYLLADNAEKNSTQNGQQLATLQKNRGLLIQTLNGIIIERAKL